MTTTMSMASHANQVDYRVALTGLAALLAVSLWPARQALAWGTDDAAMADEIATLLAVNPGSTVAEIGAGHGEMAIRMARKVGPSGHVYATEIDPGRLAEIRERAQEAGLDNLTVL